MALEMIVPPCQAACPIFTDAQGYINLIAQERFEDALRLIRETNPFPSVCGRICTHPCEDACRRARVDEPLSIRWLKRFVADNVPPPAKEPKPKRIRMKPVTSCPLPRKAKVAVVGAGPAGLSCAHDLALLGYKVTAFEAQPVAGGLLRLGIPEYRLPKKVLEKEINAIRRLGVEIKLNHPIGEKESISDLFDQGYQAVFMATGAWRAIRPQIKGIHLEGIITSLDLMRAVNLGKKVELGKKVTVIGGGNTGIDCARTCLRLGAKEVRIAEKRGEDQVQAHPAEIAEAREEGVITEFLTMPVRIYGDRNGSNKGKVRGYDCLRMKKARRGQGGRDGVVEVPGNKRYVEADNIILALGQNIDASHLTPQDQVLLNRRGLVKADRLTAATTREGIFAAGDCVSGPATATEAIAGGKRGAYAIDLYLRGEDLDELEWLKRETVEELKPETLEKITKLQRVKVQHLPIETRLKSFNPVEKGYTKDEAVREALRCLSCGAGARIDEAECVSCLTCVSVCPFGVPAVKQGDVVAIDTSQCQSCGLCVSECPAMAISLRQAGGGLERDIEEVVGKKKSKVAEFYCQYGAYGEEKPRPKKGGIKVLCVAKLHTIHLLRAAEMGAEKIIVPICSKKACRFVEGGSWAKKRVKEAQRILKDIGISPERIELRELEEPEEVSED